MRILDYHVYPTHIADEDNAKGKSDPLADLDRDLATCFYYCC